jgi:hypothetical protein
MYQRNYMKVFICLLTIYLPLLIAAQNITYSEVDRKDSRDISFEIIGKMNGNFMIYKNISWRHKLTIYDSDMKIKSNINLDFIPDKTFNVDFIVYPDFFYMIYQHQRKGILYCMAAKMDAAGNTIGEPLQLDTTQIGFFSDNKIYSTVFSENKQKILIYKIQKKNDRLNIVTLLFDNNLTLMNKSRIGMDYDSRRDVLGEMMVDNDGVTVFTYGQKPGNRDYIDRLDLVTKQPLQDKFAYSAIDLEKNYIDVAELKIDNLNKRYIINSFYYAEKRGNIQGLFACLWDKTTDTRASYGFIPFSDSLRDAAKKDGSSRFAFNDFLIRQVIVKKDGGYLLTAEDFSSQSRGNNSWSRYDYLYSPYFSQYDYYWNRNYYNSFYRPYNSFGSGNQSTRYFYDNILVISVDKNSKLNWHHVIQKEQFDDDNDNFLSFNTMNAGGEIHFLFNDDRKNQLIADHSILPDGSVKRNPILKSQEKGYQFMSRHLKQVGARQLLIPCNYRGWICFAKIDY